MKILGCIGLLAIVFALDLFIAWVLWLIYNAVAPTFHWPLIGYWTAFLLMVGLSIIGSFFKSSTSKN